MQDKFLNLDSLKGVMEEIVKNEVSSVKDEVSTLDLKIEQGLNKVYHVMEDWRHRFIHQVCYIFGSLIISANTINDLCLGTMVTGTEKGKLVMEKGEHISVPFELTNNTKKSGYGRFTNPPNINSDQAEDELQRYFITNARP